MKFFGHINLSQCLIGASTVKMFLECIESPEKGHEHQYFRVILMTHFKDSYCPQKRQTLRGRLCPLFPVQKWLEKYTFAGQPWLLIYRILDPPDILLCQPKPLKGVQNHALYVTK